MSIEPTPDMTQEEWDGTPEPMDMFCLILKHTKGRGHLYGLCADILNSKGRGKTNQQLTDDDRCEYRAIIRKHFPKVPSKETP